MRIPRFCCNCQLKFTSILFISRRKRCTSITKSSSAMSQIIKLSLVSHICLPISSSNCTDEWSSVMLIGTAHKPHLVTSEWCEVCAAVSKKRRSFLFTFASRAVADGWLCKWMNIFLVLHCSQFENAHFYASCSLPCFVFVLAVTTLWRLKLLYIWFIVFDIV